MSFVYGVKDLLPKLTDLLKSVGIRLISSPRENELESYFGLLMNTENTLSKIHPACPAYQILMIGDTVTGLIPDNLGITIQINREGKLLSCNLPKTDSIYFRKYNLTIEEGFYGLREKWMD